MYSDIIEFLQKNIFALETCVKECNELLYSVLNLSKNPRKIYSSCRENQLARKKILRKGL